MDTIKLNQGDLKVGEALPWAIYSLEGTLLLRKGHVIDNERQLDVLLSRGLYCNATDYVAAPKAPEEVTTERECPFDLINSTYPRLDSALNRLAGGHARDLDGIRRIARHVDAICDLDADAAIGAVHLWMGETYSVTHLIHSAMLACVLMKRLNYDEQRRVTTLSALLVSNVGMLDLQEQLFAQTEALTPSQQAQIDRHPARTCELLRACNIDDPLLMDIILQHHERLDGSGYPAGLRGEQVLEEARILALVDIYDAMITPRNYRKSLLAVNALRELFLSRSQLVDGTLAQLFIKELGLYPPGALVQLQNGEQAIVIKRALDNQLPVVMGIISPRGGPYARPMKRHCDNHELAITQMLPLPQNLRLNLPVLWGYA